MTIHTDAWAFFDWSGGPVHVLRGDADTPVIYGGLDDLLDRLPGPTNIRGEATFESFNVARRADVIDRCRRDGHDFKVVNPRATAKRRRALAGPDTWDVADKTNEIDVQVIRDMALDGYTHFAAPVLATVDQQDRRAAANARLMELRRTTLPRRSTRAKSGWAFDSGKDKYAEAIIEHLPPTSSLTLPQDLALCTGVTGKRRYSKCAVAAVGVVSEHASDIKTFDYLTGLYLNGYPSQIRSDLMMHRWSKSVRGHLPFTDFRRELRWLFHAVRDASPSWEGQRQTQPAEVMTAQMDRGLPADLETIGEAA